MKIKIQLSDGYEEIIEVDEEEGEIKDLGSTKEMLQDRIEKLEKLNRDMSGDVAFYHEANKECQKTIADLREKAAGWEKRCTELEQELRDAQEKLDKRVDCNERIIAARDELQKQRDALMKRLGELEQELRDAQGQLDESVRKEAQLGLEYNKLRDKIWEQNRTIARYDDENKTMWKQNRDLGEWLHKNAPRDSLTDWSKKIHGNAVAHGWWAKSDADAGESCADGDRPFGEIIALCHSELSEALEEYRNGKPMSYEGENGKPEGVAVEMIDCIIRILDWCGKEGIDVDGLLAKKHDYNKGRPFRHGGKKL